MNPSSDPTGGEAARSRTPSSGRQRMYIRTLFAQLNLSVLNISLGHRRFFVAAGIDEARHGQPVDDALTEITCDQAKALIRELQREIPRDE